MLHLLTFFFRLEKFVIPFALNQSASLLYVYLLGSSGMSHKVNQDHSANLISAHIMLLDISMAVPICNSLTFVFTAITSVILGEYPARPSRKFIAYVQHERLEHLTDTYPVFRHIYGHVSSPLGYFHLFS